MSLISIAFVFFCTAAVALYYLMPKAYRWIVLLAASLIFYGLCGIKYMLYILVTASTVYAAARRMEGLSAVRSRKTAKLFLIVKKYCI